MRTRCYLPALLVALLTVQAVASAAPRSLPERSIVPRADASLPDALELPDQIVSEPPSEAEPAETELPEGISEPGPSDAVDPAEPAETELPEGISEPGPSDAVDPAEPPPDPAAETPEQPLAAEPSPADEATSLGEVGATAVPTAETDRETSGVAPSGPEPPDASPLLEGTLALAVTSNARFGTARIGASTDAVPFEMAIQNLSEQGWQVTVEGSDLVGAEPTTPPISRTSLYLTGGSGPFPAGVITSYAGYLSTSEPLVLVRGTSEARGEFALTQATILLEVPTDAIPDTYGATLTYTIMAWEP